MRYKVSNKKKWKIMKIKQTRKKQEIVRLGLEKSHISVIMHSNLKTCERVGKTLGMHFFVYSFDIERVKCIIA